jgi:hypothetical protein
MNFTTYLARLDSALENDGAGFRKALFDAIPNTDNGLTQTDLLRFLAKLDTGLHMETKKDGDAKDAVEVEKRSKAIHRIMEFVSDERQQQGVFAGINKHKFAFQLALRVRSPRVINQDQTTLCGPVAVVYDVAKRDPERYVDFALSLYSRGFGQLGATQVVPSTTILGGYRVGLLPEADYVVLASVRDTDAIVISSNLLRDVLTLTKPGALCEFLKRAGYRDVQDHTFLNLSVPLRVLNAVTPFELNGPGHNPFDRGEANLKSAAQEAYGGRFVVMNADVQVSQVLCDPRRPPLLARTDLLPAGETHWTAIRQLSVIGNQVDIKIITWGGSYKRKLDKTALLSRYAGYVSAQP